MIRLRIHFDGNYTIGLIHKSKDLICNRINYFMQICGVDDAGRGSMLGPLVIAGISVDQSKIRKLSRIGVRDSKKLSPILRERLYKKIIQLVDSYYVAKINPRTIDRSVKKHLLNDLEAKYMAKVILKLKPNISYVDSCDVNPTRFGKKISQLAHYNKVHSYHHADDRFVVVSAASIIAKINRDRAIAKLQKKYNVGSGYPSDSKTVDFVKKYIKKNKKAPTFARYSWRPIQNILQNN